MENVIIGLKVYVLAFFGMLIIGIALNLTTRKEYRSSMREVWQQHVQIFGVMTAVGVFVSGLAWFLFRVI